jgi:uncharacterized membrane protein YbhN (UPF0104 family)
VTRPESFPRRRSSLVPRAVRAHFGTVAGAALLAVLAWRLGTGAFLDGLRRIDGPTLLAALGLGLLTTLCSAWRWSLVARALGVRLPLGSAFASYYRALFLNSALPGGVLGDVHRAVQHGKNVGHVGLGVRAVVLERTAGQVVLVAVAVPVLLARYAPSLVGTGALADRLTAVPGAVLVLAVAVAAAGALMVTAAFRLQRRRATGVSRWRLAVRDELAQARRALLARGSWPGVLVSSAAVLAGHLAMFLLAARVAGSTASAPELVPLMLLALLAMALPLNIGGWGPREGVTAWAFGAAGLGASQGLTVAVVYGVLAFAASLPGAGALVGQWLAGRRSAEAGAGVAPEAGSVVRVGAELDVEEGVLAEGGAPHPRPERVAHQLGTGEADARDTVAEQDRCDAHVQPVQRTRVQETRHRDSAALDQHAAQAPPRERPQQAPWRERVVVLQGQDLDSDGKGPPVLTAGAHQPQRRR